MNLTKKETLLIASIRVRNALMNNGNTLLAEPIDDEIVRILGELLGYTK